MQTSPGRQFGHTGPVGLTRVLACRRRDTSRATRRGKTRTRRRCCWWRDSQAASCGGYAMPRRSRSHARRTTTGVLALLTWSNEGIFTVLDTRCLLWCVSRGTLSPRNCRHISGSLPRHTLAPFPLRSRQVSTYHWPWRWYYCGVHCGRRPRASFPFWTHGLYHTFPGLGRGHVQRCLLMNLSFSERLRLVHGSIAGCVAHILDKDTTGLQPYHSAQWARIGSS